MIASVHTALDLLLQNRSWRQRMQLLRLVVVHVTQHECSVRLPRGASQCACVRHEVNVTVAVGVADGLVAGGGVLFDVCGRKGCDKR